jgi:hypothetical protein
MLSSSSNEQCLSDLLWGPVVSQKTLWLKILNAQRQIDCAGLESGSVTALKGDMLMRLCFASYKKRKGR